MNRNKWHRLAQDAKHSVQGKKDEGRGVAGTIHFGVVSPLRLVEAHQENSMAEKYRETE